MIFVWWLRVDAVGGSGGSLSPLAWDRWQIPNKIQAFIKPRIREVIDCR
jgi:hypothetical protein